MDLAPLNKIYVFVCGPIATIDIFLMLFSIVVLSQLKKSQVFVYLQIENVFILCDCVIAALFPLYKCKNCYGFINPSIQCTIDLLLFIFLSPVVETIALLFSIFAALSYLSNFNSNSSSPLNTLLIFRMNPVCLALASTLLFSLLYGSVLFSVEIGQYSNDSNPYECKWNDFSSSTTQSVLTITAYSIGYGLLVLVLVVANVVILVKLKRSFSNPKTMIQKSCNKRKSTEKKLTVLILADCLNAVISHLPYSVYYTLEIFSKSATDYNILVAYFSINFYFSFVAKFVFLYWLNKQFQKQISIKIRNYLSTMSRFLSALNSFIHK